VRSSARRALPRVPRERPQPEVLQSEALPPGRRPARCREVAHQVVPRRDVLADRLAHPYRQAVRDRPAYAAAALSRDFHPQEAQQSEVRPSEARFAGSAQVPASRREAAEAEVSSAASVQRVPSSLPGAAAEGAQSYGRAVPPWAEPVGSDARAQVVEAEPAALDARAQPREAVEAELGAGAEAEPGAERGEAAARGAGRQPGAVVEARDAVLRPEAVRDVVRRRAERDAALRRAAGLLAAASTYRRDQLLPGPAPTRVARSAHAMWKSRAASPSGPWWQAARCEGLS
jgi:hypothetical protein